MFDPNLFLSFGSTGYTWTYADRTLPLATIVAQGFIDPSQLSNGPQPGNTMLISGSDGSGWYDVDAVNATDIVLTPFP